MTSSSPKVESNKTDSYDDRLAERLAATVAILVQKRVHRELKKMAFMRGRGDSNGKTNSDEDNLY